MPDLCSCKHPGCTVDLGGPAIECPECGITIHADDVEIGVQLTGTFDGLCSGCRGESMNALLHLHRDGRLAAVDEVGEWVKERREGEDMCPPAMWGAGGGVVYVEHPTASRAYVQRKRAEKAALRKQIGSLGSEVAPILPPPIRRLL